MERLTAVFNSRERRAVLNSFCLEHDVTFEKHTNIYSFYYTTSVVPDTVLLLGLGKNVRGNMQYILDELNLSPDFEGYKVYVRVGEETEDIVNGYINKNGWKRTYLIKTDIEYAKKMESCKYLITETYFPESWVKKPEQVYINIWHGTPLKKLGLAKNARNAHGNGNTQKNFINANYLLYPNDYTYENMVESYKVRELLNGKALMLGYPRCGGLLETAAKNNKALIHQLAPRGEKIFVYMPTFKDYLPNERVVEESRELLDFLDDNLSDKQILYVNLHHKLSDVIDYSKFRHIKKFPPLVDSYALMAVSDALITDYSSVFFDYLTLGKQIILHVEDIKHYTKARGTYMDMLTLPFDMAHSKQEIIDALNRGKTYDDTQARQQFCQYDSRENAKKLCQLICSKKKGMSKVYGGFADLTGKISPLKNTKVHRGFNKFSNDAYNKHRVEGLTIRDIPKRGKRTILAVTETCPDTEEFKRLRNVAMDYDHDKADLFIATSEDRTGRGKNAYPFLFKTPVFGYKDLIKLSNEGNQLLERYRQGEFEYKQIFEILKYDYCLNVRSKFGDSKFDILLVYDITDVDQIQSMAMQNAEKKYLYLNNILIQKILENDKYTLDVLSVISQYFDRVLAFKSTVSDHLYEKLDMTAENTQWLKDVGELGSTVGVRELLMGGL
ncbi:MAG: CDP-glycerol glycerophosphotransferase family protein [Ruminococcus sp.]|nr:CDP-glycerol glycerophosphotransferase family protein [Ruminococcus sp.]